MDSGRPLSLACSLSVPSTSTVGRRLQLPIARSTRSSLAGLAFRRGGVLVTRPRDASLIDVALPGRGATPVRDGILSRLHLRPSFCHLWRGLPRQRWAKPRGLPRRTDKFQAVCNIVPGRPSLRLAAHHLDSAYRPSVPGPAVDFDFLLTCCDDGILSARFRC